ncbi:MAG TPA: TonB-dependent receptor [Bryobacteraceae bacterium]|nr:TonB-dependent receptor [Bryobacteraceae bacterium]
MRQLAALTPPAPRYQNGVRHTLSRNGGRARFVHPRDRSSTQPELMNYGTSAPGTTVNPRPHRRFALSTALASSVLAALLATVVSGNLRGQTSSSAISGTLADPSGSVIKGAEVSAQNEETSVRRSVHSDEAGRYTVEQLAPGRYQLTAQITGFETAVANKVEVFVGKTTVLNFRLKIGELQTKTLVTDAPELVETRDSALSGVMENVALRELPLNGRDVAQLALLQPGVAPSFRRADPVPPGAGVNLVIQGSRPNQISFQLDGSDINDANNATPASAAGVVLGVETLREFRVLTNSYSAEYGRSAGGVVTAITKSGTNQLHGSLFEFLRNSHFDAKNFFDSATAPIPPFKRNQYGVEVDGPIVKDKTFFLASFEQLKQRLGVTTISVVPDANARQGVLPNQSRITVNPAIVPYLALVPLPNGRNFGDGTGQYITANSQPTNDTFFAGRLDHQLSSATSLFARFTYDTAITSQPDGYNLVNASSKTLNRYLTLGSTHTFSERFVNTFRASINRSYGATTNPYLQQIDPALSYVPGRPLGQLTVTGSISLGPNRFTGRSSIFSLYQFGNDLSWVSGRHTVKVGGDYRFYSNPKSGAQAEDGYFQFSSLANFLTATPALATFVKPGSIVPRRWRQSMTSFYMQDDMRLSDRLTLNLGVRYERQSVPTEANGYSSVIRNPLADRDGTPGAPYVNPTNLGFAPRAGLAWKPFADGRTSVRGGFGLFYSPLWSDWYAAAGGNPPFTLVGSVSNPSFPNAYSQIGSQPFISGSINTQDYLPEYPYVMQYNLTLQRQFGQNGVLTASYAGSRGIHLPRLVDFNQSPQTVLSDGRVFFPAGSVRQNPNFGILRMAKTDGLSYYNALELSWEKRLGKGLLYRVNYTWSKSIDTGSLFITPGGANDMPQNPLSLKAERGLSNFDIRNNLAGYLVWEIPAVPGPKILTKGWQFNAILQFASGQPFGVTVSYDRARANADAATGAVRPDLCPGASNNPILGGPDQYFNPRAFCLQEAGFYGNLGRNTLIGPGLILLTPALSKQFVFRERVRIQFRSEFFNVLNHPNFAAPGSRVVYNNSGLVGSAGLITATTTTSRQIQFGLKLSF